MGHDVGLQGAPVTSLVWTGGAAQLVSVDIQHVCVESGPGPEQLPTHLTRELLLLVISLDMAQEIFLIMGCEVTLLTLEHF